MPRAGPRSATQTDVADVRSPSMHRTTSFAASRTSARRTKLIRQESLTVPVVPWASEVPRRCGRLIGGCPSAGELERRGGVVGGGVAGHDDGVLHDEAADQRREARDDDDSRCGSRSAGPSSVEGDRAAGYRGRPSRSGAAGRGGPPRAACRASRCAGGSRRRRPARPAAATVSARRSRSSAPWRRPGKSARISEIAAQATATRRREEQRPEQAGVLRPDRHGGRAEQHAGVAAEEEPERRSERADQRAAAELRAVDRGRRRWPAQPAIALAWAAAESVAKPL